MIDRAGNAIALTCTIEQEFGSAVVAPGTGFLLNNELTDFGDPGTANQPGPGKRPRSSMAPTIVVRGRTPGPGGRRRGRRAHHHGRRPGGAQRGRLRQQSIARAIDAERIDDPSGTLTIEDARVAPEVIASLLARGHTLTRVGEYDIRPRMQAAGVGPRGVRSAVSDSRSELGSFAQTGR